MGRTSPPYHPSPSCSPSSHHLLHPPALPLPLLPSAHRFIIKGIHFVLLFPSHVHFWFFLLYVFVCNNMSCVTICSYLDFVCDYFIFSLVGYFVPISLC